MKQRQNGCRKRTILQHHVFDLLIVRKSTPPLKICIRLNFTYPEKNNTHYEEENTKPLNAYLTRKAKCMVVELLLMNGLY